MEIKTKGFVFGAIRLPNGSTIVSTLNKITEYNKNGKQTWEFNPSKDLPKYGINRMTGIHSLANGNLVVGCYSAYNLKKGTGLGIFEITRDKKLVWGYRNPHADKSHMGVQLLDGPITFNEIR
jgi:hypothetical protein